MELNAKHTKDGIMRRNGLLLEHIMHERLNKSIETINYYQRPTPRYDEY